MAVPVSVCVNFKLYCRISRLIHLILAISRTYWMKTELRPPHRFPQTAVPDTVIAVGCRAARRKNPRSSCVPRDPGILPQNIQRPYPVPGEPAGGAGGLYRLPCDSRRQELSGPGQARTAHPAGKSVSMPRRERRGRRFSSPVPHDFRAPVCQSSALFFDAARAGDSSPCSCPIPSVASVIPMVFSIACLR